MAWKIPVLSLFIFTIFPAIAFPANYIIYDQDAAAAGMGNAFVAVADHPSAVFYNPAGINQLQGTQLRVSGRVVFVETSFRGSASREKTDMRDDPAFTGAGFLTHKVNDRISLGGGMFAPFSLISEWPEYWEGRTVATYTDLRTVCINPVVSIKVHPRLSLALGVDYLYADFELRRVIDPGEFIPLLAGLPEGKARLKGKDDTWGYNVGLLYDIADGWKMGVSFRSKFNLEFDGHADSHLPRILNPLYPDTDISPRLELPPEVAVGVSVRLWAKWTLATEILWTGWSTVDQLMPRFRRNNPLLVPQKMRVLPKDWEDAVAFHLGVRYRHSEAWTFRAGYAFDESPVPESTLDPLVPHFDSHLFTFGLGYWQGCFEVDAACTVMFFEDRHTRRNPDGLNGKYESMGVSFLLGITMFL
jgi:long-chain fatty acid transport protein